MTRKDIKTYSKQRRFQERYKLSNEEEKEFFAKLDLVENDDAPDITYEYVNPYKRNYIKYVLVTCAMLIVVFITAFTTYKIAISDYSNSTEVSEAYSALNDYVKDNYLFAENEKYYTYLGEDQKTISIVTFNYVDKQFSIMYIYLYDESSSNYTLVVNGINYSCLEEFTVCSQDLGDVEPKIDILCDGNLKFSIN